ncbi:MAG: sigma-54-dependent Fis family transcriptional regulator [Deltaproteobacteria bacterium]|nr:sigma-54-dependent Fis family transcriptional regulator [Deltaproteobacteria bacterium]
MLDVLLVDDDSGARAVIAAALREAGHCVSEAADAASALAQVQVTPFHLAVCDVVLPGTDGVELFRRIRRTSPLTDVILITAHATVQDAVAMLKEGAYDYLTKPFHPDELLARLARIDEQRALRRELREARAELARAAPGAAVVGRSPAMVKLLHRVETFADSNAPVMITGETGTGKELVATMLHARSARRDRPFVAVNCAAFPETLLEAELFGHDRGAFTGALKRREGRFAAAHGGSLLLDELVEMPLASQAKLLRVVQEGKVEPLGTNQTVDVDVRVISATHHDVRKLVREGRFREDLYYRLHVLDIHVPPLRERRSDLPLLVEHFLRRSVGPGKPVPTVSPRAWAALHEHRFNGNVRELAHCIEHAVVLSGGGEIDLPHLPETIAGIVTDVALARGETIVRPLGEATREFEREYLSRALARCGGRRAEAARLLGISRKSLWKKMRDLALEPGEPEGD